MNRAALGDPMERLGDFLRRVGIPQEAIDVPLPPKRTSPDGDPQVRATLRGVRSLLLTRDLPLSDDTCPVCRGAGFVLIQGSPRGPWFDVAQECQCVVLRERAERLTRLREYARLPLGEWVFDDYEAVTTEAERVRDMISWWARDDAQPWLFLRGTHGTGKTHLACAAGEALMERGQSVAFHVAAELVADFGVAVGADERSKLDHDHVSAVEALRTRVTECDCLILDDLGSERATPYAEERLYEIVGHRYYKRSRLIVTTNARAQDLDQRIVSRLLDGRLSTHLEMAWDDYRRKL